jgi:hypothetical protein
MPIQVPIQSVPNQLFDITLDNNAFQISIKTTNGVMSMSVSINGEFIVENVRVVAGAPVIPYRYKEKGNFVFFTANYELPIYTAFNTTQYLAYYTASELEVIRLDISFPITENNFNPIADLPLRFSPVGYVSA